MLLTLDECRDAGVIKDTLKLFISGGMMPLRRNHEQETHYTSFAFSAKCWLLNTADAPLLPAALETSHSREVAACATCSPRAASVARRQPRSTEQLRRVAGPAP